MTITTGWFTVTQNRTTTIKKTKKCISYKQVPLNCGRSASDVAGGNSGPGYSMAQNSLVHRPGASEAKTTSRATVVATSEDGSVVGSAPSEDTVVAKVVAARIKSSAGAPSRIKSMADTPLRSKSSMEGASFAVLVTGCAGSAASEETVVAKVVAARIKSSAGAPLRIKSMADTPPRSNSSRDGASFAVLVTDGVGNADPHNPHRAGHTVGAVTQSKATASFVSAAHALVSAVAHAVSGAVCAEAAFVVTSVVARVVAGTVSDGADVTGDDLATVTTVLGSVVVTGRVVAQAPHRCGHASGTGATRQLRRVSEHTAWSVEPGAQDAWSPASSTSAAMSAGTPV